MSRRARRPGRPTAAMRSRRAPRMRSTSHRSRPAIRRKVGDSTGAASWSADGKEIAYVATGKLTIDVVKTGKKTKLSAGTHVPQADAPAWQP